MNYYDKILKKATSEDRDDRIFAACYLNEEDRAQLLADSDSRVRAAAKYRMTSGQSAYMISKKYSEVNLLRKKKKKKTIACFVVM